MATPPPPPPPGELSKRMGTTVKIFLPIAAALASRGKTAPGDIDLSHGENSLMKAQVVDLCKDALNKSITEDVSHYDEQTRK